MDVLSIYQPKLTTIEREKRWKHIPVFLDQQKSALKFVGTGKLQAPIYKKMATTFDGHVTLYGGRKGFEELMNANGQSLTDIAQWMGHQGIERTWTKYRNRNRIAFKMPTGA